VVDAIACRLRRTLSALRNEGTARKRRGLDCESLYKQIQAVRKEYFSQITKQKATHWREFVDDPANIWRADQYTHMDPVLRGVPALQGSEGIVDQDEEKARTLLQAFFPPQSEPEDGYLDDNRASLPTQPYKKIMEAEIRITIFWSDPKQAPGPDDIPFLV
jgi:hypothetical protein